MQSVLTATKLQSSTDLPAGYRLRRPLAVRVWLEHDEYVADADELRVRGFGATPTEAMRSLCEEIVEQFRLLANLDDRLAPPMQELAETFRLFVAPPHA